MFTNLTLRTKLVAIVVPPLVVLAVVAAYAVLLGFRGADSLDALSGDVRVLGVTALASFLLSALAVIVIGRTITDPLDELSEAADELANVRLPLLVESLRTPGIDTPEFAPIALDQQNDEMGKLVAALNAVQDSAAQVASEQQTIVRQGLSELVVNLARRNQSLLDRQIEFIDRLESNEEDPDRLEELFGLDHLATRMRRNAESLLVLAGAEPARRRGGPVAAADILRVAMSEIEDYRHVNLMKIDDAEIGASAAVDLAHLLSEIMENATQFSPPESPVEVNGMGQPDGCYLITVTDHGLGMTEEQVTASNHILANPPELGLGLSRSLGFIVIGRLAERLEVEVELAFTEGGGITALVLVPASIMTDGQQSLTDQVLPDAAAMPAPAPQAAMPPPPGAMDSVATAPVPVDEEVWVPPAMPERGVGFGDASAPVPAPAPEAPPAGMPADAPQSEALAKLLGVAPPAAPSEPAAFDPAPPAPEPAAFDPAPPAPEPAAFDAAPPAPVAFDAAAPHGEPTSFDQMPGLDVPIEPPGFEPSAFEAPAPEFDAPAPGFDAPADTSAPYIPDFDAEPLADLMPEAPAEVMPEAPAPDPFAPPAGAPDPFAPPVGAPDPFAPDLSSLAGDAPNADLGAADQGFGGLGPTDFETSFGSVSFEPASEPLGGASAEPDVWNGPNFGAPETVPGPADASPANLEQAIPTGDQFDSGMASLLDTPSPNAGTTSSGLVKRDRSKSQAPVSEGRPVKASARSPEEVRQMLARYRDGRNRPTNEATDPNSNGELS